MTPADAAAADNALSLMLWGAGPLLPLILGYTAYVYWVFRAKVDDDAAYH
jgi:cytochrome d ubiquinol oxidase subunit II